MESLIGNGNSNTSGSYLGLRIKLRTPEPGIQNATFPTVSISPEPTAVLKNKNKKVRFLLTLFIF